VLIGFVIVAVVYFICALVAPDFADGDGYDLRAFHASEGRTYIAAFLVLASSPWRSTLPLASRECEELGGPEPSCSGDHSRDPACPLRESALDTDRLPAGHGRGVSYFPAVYYPVLR
jgi:hypothetical protein